MRIGEKIGQNSSLTQHSYIQGVSGVLLYTTDAKSDRRFRRFIDRAKLPSNGRANRIDAMNVVDLLSWLPRRQIVAALTVRRIKIRLMIFN
ncbi:hypothetical protein PCASD_21230 [Puccinia coronata f. sp. avenae]|uniref:Uncharacterized protein n=1 Tax=Puccinia coronata f. sp. avenae TaxID=200324 RepID=A0A2N5TNK1_9BASI|nr:hypothetical protein PCASD_21230 [Puccinia coronata f. sp. avenae]